MTTQHSIPDTRTPCDLVMKGGITSGVAYPKALLELKDTYRFRKIGGTSAGAIAALAVAAAEYNCDCSGCQTLEEMGKWLGEKGHIRGLFQPSADTRPLMNIINVLFPPPSSVKKSKESNSFEQ